MDISLFVAISMGLILLPGPAVLVVISTSMSRGRSRGLQTVAGISVAMLVQLFVAAMGTAWFVSTLTQGLVWLKWAGVVYLVFLGFRHLIFAAAKRPHKEVSANASFQRGFWVSLTNPKTILFFSAFLPQFVSPSGDYLQQVTLLSGIFWILAAISDSAYALLASRLGALLKSDRTDQYQNIFSGILYLGAGAFLAATKESP